MKAMQPDIAAKNDVLMANFTDHFTRQSAARAPAKVAEVSYDVDFG